MNADVTARAGPAQAPPGRPTTVRQTERPTATDRLQRLLALVPYVVSRNAGGMAETAAAFGITEPELVDDLNMLWCVELRSPDPYCPIDLSYEGGEIVVSEAEAMDRPLRLGVDEACALLIGLRMLAELPSIGDGSALSRTIAKLEAAAGSAANPSAQVAVQVDHLTGASMTAQVTDALSQGRRVHISYYVPGRDEATERDVDPMRLLVVEGRSYLEGWCRRAGAGRLFRRGPGMGRAGCSGLPRRTSSSSWSWPRPAAGSPSTTRASRLRSCPTGGCGSRCARRTPSGCVGWRCGSAKTAGLSPRRSSPSRSAMTLRQHLRTMGDIGVPTLPTRVNAPDGCRLTGRNVERLAWSPRVDSRLRPISRSTLLNGDRQCLIRARHTSSFS